MSNQLLTTAEVAKNLRVSPGTLHRWRKSGEGPPYTQVGRKVFYSAADLAQWIAGQRREPQSQEAAR